VIERSHLEPLGWPLIRLALVVIVGGVAPLIDTTVVNVALSTIGASLHVNAAAVQWIATVYLLALAATIPVTIWASDRFGAKRMWVIGLSIFLTGSGLCALSWSFGALVTFRALQGIGAGIMLPLLQTILVRAAGPGRVGRVLTVVLLVSTISPIAGPVLGGAVVAAGNWRWVFAINLPICVAAIILALVFIPPSPRLRDKRLDLPGVLLLGGGVTALLYSLSNAASTSSNLVRTVWAPLAIGVILFVLFILWSRSRGAAAAIPLSLFRDRSFRAVTVVLFLAGLALYSGLFLIPLYFQQQHAATALGAGLILALQGVGSLATRWVGRVVDRIGAKLIAAIGILVCSAATLPFVFAMPHSSYLLLGAALVVRGGSLSAVNIAVTAGAFAGLSSESVPAGAAIVRLVQQLGGSTGAALIATILTAATVAGQTSAGFQAAFGWSVALIFVAIVPCLFIARSPTAGGSQQSLRPSTQS
jgi:EmrB/QacA subfamily drug resistance transporter